MTVNLLFLLLLGLILSSPSVDQKDEAIENDFEVVQKEKRNATSGTFIGGEVSKVLSDRESRATSISSDNAGDIQPQTFGIPGGEKNNSGLLFSVLLSVSVLGFAAWLIFKKKYSTIGTYGATVIEEVNLKGSGEEFTDVASANPPKNNEEDKQLFRIKEFMIAKQPYLDPEFTIKAMADQLDMEVRELSLVLNTSFQQNFYDFLNHYRIEKAKDLLKDPGNKKLTILEVLYSVGFNSKSSFNTSFKKLSGLTPTQYRQKYCR